MLEILRLTGFEVVPATMVYEFGAYGIPGRFSHWTHGKAYFHMKTMYDYGLSKIYELVINANPSQAFLLDTNDHLENKMVMAHVLGHLTVPTVSIVVRKAFGMGGVAMCAESEIEPLVGVGRSSLIAYSAVTVHGGWSAPARFIK